MNDRIAKVLSNMEKAGLDQILVSAPGPSSAWILQRPSSMCMGHSPRQSGVICA